MVGPSSLSVWGSEVRAAGVGGLGESLEELEEVAVELEREGMALGGGAVEEVEHLVDLREEWWCREVSFSSSVARSEMRRAVVRAQRLKSRKK